MSTTGGPHLYSRSREIGRKYDRTSNSEKCARLRRRQHDSRYRLPADVKTRARYRESIQPARIMLALLFRADGSCPRFYRNVVDSADGSRRAIRKSAGIKRILYCESSKKEECAGKNARGYLLKYDILCVRVR